MLLDTPGNSHAARVLFTSAVSVLFSYGRPAAIKIGSTFYATATFHSHSTERHVREFTFGYEKIVIVDQAKIEAFGNAALEAAADRFANINET